jgi:hypothetical protein
MARRVVDMQSVGEAWREAFVGEFLPRLTMEWVADRIRFDFSSILHAGGVELPAMQSGQVVMKSRIMYIELSE